MDHSEQIGDYAVYRKSQKRTTVMQKRKFLVFIPDLVDPPRNFVYYCSIELQSYKQGISHIHLSCSVIVCQICVILIYYNYPN
jgi:hypothetical protein